MTFGLTIVIALAAGLIGRRLHAEYTPARAFCYLWAIIIVGWEVCNLLFGWWDKNYSAAVSGMVYSWAIWGFYLVGAALNVALLHFLKKNRTGYLLIGCPIFFCLIMGLCVPFEAALLETTYTHAVFNSLAKWFALSELFLLAVDRNEHRRGGKRVIQIYFDKGLVAGRNLVMDRVLGIKIHGRVD